MRSAPFKPHRTLFRAGIIASLAALVPAVRVVAQTSNGEHLTISRPRSSDGSHVGASRAKTSSTTARVRRVSRGRVKVAPTPLVVTTPYGAAALGGDLSALLNARVKRGTWGVLVTSVSRGDTLFAHNADMPLMPASTLKLFTTVLAFERLGVQHQMQTAVLRDGEVGTDGTLQGSLVLRGGGDPALAGRFLGGQPEAPMQALAQMVVHAGIKRVTGDIIGDASAFEEKRIPDGWLARYLGASYAARVSALSLNNNLLHVAISPTAAAKAATVSLRPALSGYKIVNLTRTSGTGRGARLTVSRRGDGAIVVTGWIGGRSQPRVYTVVVDDPARFATAAFKKALEQEGVEVKGDVKVASTPPTALSVGALSSPPLYQLANVMNRESDNHFAELMLRAASRGHEAAIVGSARLGNEQLKALLGERAGVASSAISISDGSGLSSLNRVTARALTQLLMYANRAPWAREFHQSLPVAGVSETLRSRMASTPARGNLHAKTGTTNDVIALGGYVTSRSGELLAFSMFYNGRERWNARETIDAMGATMAGFAR
ncbi:MAG: D-alanyl-D-alanine carboxypeptidase/D-alanyl-D-alanine endopeptidase [Gemmatimonadaceae bacterium]